MFPPMICFSYVLFHSVFQKQVMSIVLWMGSLVSNLRKDVLLHSTGHGGSEISKQLLKTVKEYLLTLFISNRQRWRCQTERVGWQVGTERNDNLLCVHNNSKLGHHSSITLSWRPFHLECSLQNVQNKSFFSILQNLLWKMVTIVRLL